MNFVGASKVEHQAEEVDLARPGRLVQHQYWPRSMGKAEVQPLVAFILRVLRVLVLLILTHRIPLLLPGTVAPCIVQPGEDKQRKSKAVDGDKHAVATMIQGLVVLAIDVG